MTTFGQPGTGDYEGKVWNGKAWVDPERLNEKPKSGNRNVIIALVVVGALVLILLASCVALVGGTSPSGPAPKCPTAAATSVGGAFEQGFQNGLNGCQ